MRAVGAKYEGKQLLRPSRVLLHWVHYIGYVEHKPGMEPISSEAFKHTASTATEAHLAHLQLKTRSDDLVVIDDINLYDMQPQDTADDGIGAVFGGPRAFEHTKHHIATKQHTRPSDSLRWVVAAGSGARGIMA